MRGYRGKRKIWPLPEGSSGTNAIPYHIGGLKIFGAKTQGRLPNFQMWCTAGYGEGQGQFSKKFTQNVKGIKGGTGYSCRKKLRTQQIFSWRYIYYCGRHLVYTGITNLNFSPGVGSSHPKVDPFLFSVQLFGAFCRRETRCDRNYFYARFYNGTRERKWYTTPGPSLRESRAIAPPPEYDFLF